jgi:hypothetical protein
VNQTITFLSVLHIAFQPFFINAFAMELVSRPLQARERGIVYGACALSAIIMLMQLYPFSWAGMCRPGSALCGPVLCTVSGDWHMAWDVPYNGLLESFVPTIAVWKGFPTYFVAAFFVPLWYGAWKFVVFHSLVGPILSGQLTKNPNEAPAIWCLFSIGIVLISLSPVIRQRFQSEVVST